MSQPSSQTFVPDRSKRNPITRRPLGNRQTTLRQITFVRNWENRSPVSQLSFNLRSILDTSNEYQSSDSPVAAAIISPVPQLVQGTDEDQDFESGSSGADDEDQEPPKKKHTGHIEFGPDEDQEHFIPETQPTPNSVKKSKERRKSSALKPSEGGNDVVPESQATARASTNLKKKRSFSANRSASILGENTDIPVQASPDVARKSVIKERGPVSKTQLSVSFSDTIPETQPERSAQKQPKHQDTRSASQARKSVDDEHALLPDSVEKARQKKGTLVAVRKSPRIVTPVIETPDTTGAGKSVRRSNRLVTTPLSGIPKWTTREYNGPKALFKSPQPNVPSRSSEEQEGKTGNNTKQTGDVERLAAKEQRKTTSPRKAAGKLGTRMRKSLFNEDPGQNDPDNGREVQATARSTRTGPRKVKASRQVQAIEASDEDGHIEIEPNQQEDSGNEASVDVREGRSDCGVLQENDSIRNESRAPSLFNNRQPSLGTTPRLSLGDPSMADQSFTASTSTGVSTPRSGVAIRTKRLTKDPSSSNDKESSDECYTVRVWQATGKKRKVSDVVDIDIMLNCFEETAWEMRQEITSMGLKRALNVFARKTQQDLRDTLAVIHNVSQHRKSLEASHRKLTRAKKQLMETQCAKIELQYEVAMLEDQTV